MAAETDFELGEVILILGVVGVGLYFVYKAFSGLGCYLQLSGGVKPTIDAQGAHLGYGCIPQAALDGAVTPAMVDALKARQEQAFPGVPKSQVDADVDWAVAAVQKANDAGPNTLQYAFNYWFGTNFGNPPASAAGADGSPSCPSPQGSCPDSTGMCLFLSGGA